MASRKEESRVDRYISILAVVSSFCAIGITFYQAYLQRTQQYASAMPILACAHTNMVNGGYGYSFFCINNGLGPAFIDEATYVYKNKTYASIDDVAMLITADSTATTSDLGKGWVIPQGQPIDIIQVDGRQNAHDIRHKVNEGELTVKLVYRSVYGQRWRLTVPSEKPEETIVELK